MSDMNKVEVGDTIEAIWRGGELEARVVGVVARIDEDGDYETAGGLWINYNESFSTERAPVVNVLKKAPGDPVEKFRAAPVGSVARKENGAVFHKIADNLWARVSERGYGIFRWPDQAMVDESGVTVVPPYENVNA